MIAVEFRFLARHYHATPWDAQVNEGLVEWPPSPWRILRTLIATWHYKGQQDIPEPVLMALIEKLSAELPVFSLPRENLGFGHTRHYMPLYRAVIDGKTTKVFDTFLRIPDDSLVGVVWPATELDQGEAAALGVLVERIGYLGRAESWAEGRVRGEPGGLVNSRPFEDKEPLGPEEELVKLLAPLAEGEYQAWRQGFGEAEKSQPKKGKAALKAIPESVYLALQLDTAALRAQGWSQPPGSRFVLYRRPGLRPGSSLEPAGWPQKTKKTPTVARYAVASAVPPRLTEAVAMAERIRVALMARSDGAIVFAGKDEASIPLKKGHQHAHIFCESYGNRGEITHITLYAPMGFDDEDLVSLAGLRKVWGKGGHDLQLIYLGCGTPEDFAGMRGTQGQCPLFGRSRSWVSQTPFIPTRMPKYNRNGKPRLDENNLHQGTPEHDLRRLLRLDGKPDPIAVEPLSETYLGKHKTRWLEFSRSRKNDPGGKLGYGFRIVFAEPVQGPLALGYGRHFGLGLFLPEG